MPNQEALTVEQSTFVNTCLADPQQTVNFLHTITQITMLASLNKDQVEEYPEGFTGAVFIINELAALLKSQLRPVFEEQLASMH